MVQMSGQSAHDQDSAVRNLEIPATELVGLHLDRVDELNSVLNAIVQRDDERAMARAGEIDWRLANRKGVGRLAGVVFTAQDVIETEAVRSIQDCRLLAACELLERSASAPAVPVQPEIPANLDRLKSSAHRLEPVALV